MHQKRVALGEQLYPPNCIKMVLILFTDSNLGEEVIQSRDINTGSDFNIDEITYPFPNFDGA